MHRTFIAFTLLASTTIVAQMPAGMAVDSATQRVTYEAVFDAPGTKAELFERLNGWFTQFYPNAARTITLTDAEIGKIESDPRFTLYIEDKKGTSYAVGLIKYSLKVWVKDGKVRYKLTDINIDHTVYYGIENWTDPNHQDAENNPKKLEKISAYVSDLIANLKKFMTTIVVPVDEDKW